MKLFIHIKILLEKLKAFPMSHARKVSSYSVNLALIKTLVISLSEVVLRMRALPISRRKHGVEIQVHSCSRKQMEFLLESRACIPEGMLGMPARPAHSVVIYGLIQKANVSGIVSVCTSISLFVQRFLFIICPFLQK